jgi:hypothetical protein
VLQQVEFWGTHQSHGSWIDEETKRRQLKSEKKEDMATNITEIKRLIVSYE